MLNIYVIRTTDTFEEFLLQYRKHIIKILCKCTILWKSYIGYDWWYKIAFNFNHYMSPLYCMMWFKCQYRDDMSMLFYSIQLNVILSCLILLWSFCFQFFFYFNTFDKIYSRLSQTVILCKNQRLLISTI